MWKRGTALFSGPCGARGPKRQPPGEWGCACWVHSVPDVIRLWRGRTHWSLWRGIPRGDCWRLKPAWLGVCGRNPRWDWLRGSMGIDYSRSGYFKDPEESWWAFSIAALEEIKQLSGPTSWKAFLLWDYWSVTKADAGRYHSTAPAAKPRRAWDRGRCWWLLRASLVFLGVYLSLSLSPFHCHYYY